jgi:hypothetical protein
MHNEATREKKERTFGPAWSIVFLPLLFIAAGLSFPYGFVAKLRTANRERRFAEAMRMRGRTLDWNGLSKRLEAGQGTLIVERLSLKGPARLWWTADSIYELCPHPLVERLTMFNDPEFEAAAEWLTLRYTGVDGRGFLVLTTREQMRTLVQDHGLTDGIRWVDVQSPRNGS